MTWGSPGRSPGTCICALSESFFRGSPGRSPGTCICRLANAFASTAVAFPGGGSKDSEELVACAGGAGAASLFGT